MDPHFCKMQWRSPDKLQKTRMSPNAKQIVYCITFIQHNVTLSNSYQKYVNWLCVYLRGHHAASLWADCPVGRSTLDLACTAVRGAWTHPETSAGSHGASTACELCQAESRRAGGQSCPNSSWQAPAPPGDEPPKWLQTPQGWPQFLSWLLVVRFLAAYLKSQWPWGLSFPFKIRIYILSSWTVGSFSFCLKISFLKSKYQMTNVIDVCVEVPPYLKYLG